MAQPAASGHGRQGYLARAGVSGAILILLGPAPAWAAPLQIVVTGAESTQGNVLVAVCTEREFLQPHCTWNGSAKAHTGPVAITVEVPPGTYAVQAFQDEDLNGVVSLNALGLPTEPLGFSNNPTVRFSAPRFRDCVIQVGAMGGRIDVTLKKLF